MARAFVREHFGSVGWVPPRGEAIRANPAIWISLIVNSFFFFLSNSDLEIFHRGIFFYTQLLKSKY